MKKFVLGIFFTMALFFVANAQVTGNDIVNEMRKADTKENKCYTTSGNEGRYRPTERTTTTSSSSSSGYSKSSGSTSTTGSTGATIGTSTNASTNVSRTYNSGNSSHSSSNSNTQSTTVKETCVDKDKLPLYR
jgi:hypothetical protein